MGEQADGMDRPSPGEGIVDTGAPRIDDNDAKEALRSIRVSVTVGVVVNKAKPRIPTAVFLNDATIPVQHPPRIRTSC